MCSDHCGKYVEILRKGTVSAYFQANSLKLCENCAFQQIFHTWKSGEITVFFAADVICKMRNLPIPREYEEVLELHNILSGGSLEY